MTAKDSRINNLLSKVVKNRFILTRLKNNIVQNKKIAILILILHLIGFPLIAILGTYETFSYHRYGRSADVEGLVFIGVLAGGIALFIGFIVAMNMFRYQYKKTIVDMNMSLPLTSKQRFFTDYFSGLIIYVAPALLAWLLGDLVFLTGLALNLPAIKDILFTTNALGVIVIITMVLFYTLTVFCTICCGSLFEAISSSLLVNIAIPVFFLSLGVLSVESNSFGIEQMLSLFNAIYYTSPVGAILFIFDNLMYLEPLSENLFKTPVYFTWILLTLLFISALVFLAYRMYKKRKAEQVSKPYVYKWLYNVIVFMLSFAFLSAMFISEEPLVGLIACAILYGILEVITNRGFKKIGESVIRYIVVVLFTVIIVVASEQTDGFGLYKYVPNKFNISAVAIDLNYDHPNYYVSDKESIQAVIDLQKKCIDDYETGYSGYEALKANNNKNILEFASEDYINISYYTKTGGIVKRYYSVSRDDISNLLETLKNSGEASVINSDMQIFDHLNLQNGNTYVYEYKTNRKSRLNLSPELEKELLSAYKKDLENAPKLEGGYYSTDVVAYIGYAGGKHAMSTIEIRASFSNTIEFLKQQGVDLDWTGSSLKAEDFDKVSISLFTDIISHRYVYYDAEYYRHGKTLQVVQPDYINRCYYKYSLEDYDYMISYNSVVDEDLLELLNACRNTYTGTEIGGVVVIDENIYYLPPEYKDLLNKVKENKLNYNFG